MTVRSYFNVIAFFGLVALAPQASSAAEPQVSSGDGLSELRLVEGDEKANEARSLKTEMLVLKAEAAAINQAHKLLKKHRGTPMEPEILFRLAELYMRRAKSARFFEIHRNSDTVVKVTPREMKSASSRKAILSAVNTYEAIQRRFPRFSGLDLVVFNNAFARQQLGQDREAERLYWSLVQNFKSSPLVPDAHLAIGEINFEKGNFTFALEHFNSIKKYPESRVYPYGLYKAGWTYYNLRDTAQGLKKLEEVVAYGRYVSENQIESRLDLRKEALADMTLFFEDVHPSKKAFSYFRDQAGEMDVGPVILKLAKLYERHSRFGDRHIVLSDFIKHLPKDSYLAQVQSELVWNLDSMKKTSESVVELKKLADLCRPSSSWMREQLKRTNGKDESGCQGLVSDASLKLASRWLKIWNKEPKQVELADSAEQAFVVYLSYPSTDKEYIEARFAYAELLFKRSKFREASSQYEMVAQVAKDSLRHDSAYAAVLSLEKATQDKWSDKDETEFKRLTGAYVKAFPKGKYVLDLEFKVALIAYEKERYEEAGAQFIKIGKAYPLVEKGRKAQDLYLDILNIKKDYKQLMSYSTEVLNLEKDSKRRGQLKNVYEQAYFMSVQQSEEKGQVQQAIKDYKAFALANKQSPLAEKAWWNAVQLQRKEDDLVGSAEAAMVYAAKFPKAAHRTDAMMYAAQVFESVGHLAKASDVLMQLSSIDSKNQKQWVNLAVDFLVLSGRYDQAKPHLRELSRSADTKVRTAALDKLLLIDRHEGSKGRIKLLEAMADVGTPDRSYEARAELVELMYQRGEKAGAFNEAKRVVGAKDASASAKARARFIQAQVLEEEFRQQSVKARADRVATVLAIKTEKLEKAQQAYTQAIKYGHPQTALESLHRLAGCYSHFVESLRGMPLPQGLTPADEPEFRSEISKLSIPLEEKVIETLQQGMTSAAQYRVSGPVVESMKSDLRKWNMPVPESLLVGRIEPSISLPMLVEVNP